MFGFIRRHRRVSMFLVAVFFAFELSRLVVLSEFLLPVWRSQAAAIGAMAAQPPHVAIIALSTTLLAFVLPMAGVAFALLRLSRWLRPRLAQVNDIS